MTGELQKIQVPTLVLHGDQDASAPIELTGRKTAALLGSATLRVYPRRRPRSVRQRPRGHQHRHPRLHRRNPGRPAGRLLLMRTVGATATATVRFLLELGAYASLGYWGASTRGAVALRAALAVLAPLAAILV
jgi:hypothetical protein